jgi:hypothetical protein
VDQKWKDFLNVAATEPVSWDHGADFRDITDRLRKGESEKPQAKKTPTGGVHATTASDQGNGGGAAPKGREKAPLKCKFADLTRCTGSHPPWMCKGSGIRHPKKGVG